MLGFVEDVGKEFLMVFVSFFFGFYRYLNLDPDGFPWCILCDVDFLNTCFRSYPLPGCAQDLVQPGVKGSFSFFVPLPSPGFVSPCIAMGRKAVGASLPDGM